MEKLFLGGKTYPNLAKVERGSPWKNWNDIISSVKCHCGPWNHVNGFNPRDEEAFIRHE